jgi:hypothetical protein
VNSDQDQQNIECPTMYLADQVARRLTHQMIERPFGCDIVVGEKSGYCLQCQREQYQQDTPAA